MIALKKFNLNLTIKEHDYLFETLLEINVYASTAV